MLYLFRQQREGQRWNQTKHRDEPNQTKDIKKEMK
jgi:hypothetical protein